MKVDDYGCFYADTRLLKAHLFPLLLDSVREADLLRWMAECQKAGLIVLYESDGKKYLQIVDFKQRLDKAKSKYPLPSSTDFPETVNEFPAEREGENEVESENEPEVKRAKALPGARAPLRKFEDGESLLKEEFSSLEIPTTTAEAWQVVKDWISNNKPQFVEPYFTAWNIFATFYKLTKMRDVPASRRKKFNVRIKEKGFDFLEILGKVRGSETLKSASWFTFDWLIENDRNYLKVLEGNYR